MRFSGGILKKGFLRPLPSDVKKLETKCSPIKATYQIAWKIATKGAVPHLRSYTIACVFIQIMFVHRLEFMGDAVLGAVVATVSSRLYPQRSPGHLTVRIYFLNTSAFLND